MTQTHEQIAAGPKELFDAFVSRALQVSISGEGGWSEYARNQWKQMLAAILRSQGGKK